MIHEDFTEEVDDNEELTNVIPSEDPMDSELTELEHSDNEMLKNIVAAILSDEPTSTTPGSLIEAVTRGRKRCNVHSIECFLRFTRIAHQSVSRLRGGSLFNPEGRRANSIFNRQETSFSITRNKLSSHGRPST